MSLAAVMLIALPGVASSFAQEEQSIMLATSKGHYIPGDMVQLSGTVTGQPNSLVAL